MAADPVIVELPATEYGSLRRPLEAIADGWRPFRSWVALLLRARRADES